MAGLFEMDLDTLGAGVRGLLEHPSFAPAQRQRGAQSSLWDQQGAYGQPAGNLFQQDAGGVPTTNLFNAATSAPGQLGSTYSRLANLARLALSPSSPLGAGVGKGAAVATTTAGGSTPSSGLAPGVAKWAGQAQQTFGDLGADLPDTMLAIMTNESGGDPNAYNAAGDAWGLFQNVGLGSRDPDAQFAAARALVQQKLASIAQSYAANGLNPDERTRARDVALAWAGHFDYGTGRPNPSSRDVGSGQTADQLGAIFLGNYDRIKAGRQQAQAPQARGTGMASVWGGGTAPITQEFGDTDYSGGHPDTYAYGATYGVSGHTGLDIGLARGTRLYSPVAGTVGLAGTGGYFRDEDYGDSGNSGQRGEILIQLDNGDQIILGHTSAINVRAGQRVDAGTLVGLSGSANGDHLHLEVRQRQADGSYRIIDPRAYFGG